ncbi:hypothetical protein [Pseudoalteromonas sp. MMG005]|uniref:hypothetical protein n=1 Tax=Pseudoalteromonas sp. MMG005 TaxID=2822682 RepID=UPI001B3A00FD|nr:hypothetical protein [Pseudoalteromonas sp. MMG005]MBQ4844942.1 hypothetical protein [Pseudoalteromonas sp. MMG005]
MTIETGLTQLQIDVAELTDESVKLANSVTSSLATIDAVKGDIQNTHDFVDSNYQAMNDWQTKHGTVTFKNLQGQNKQVNTLSKLILDSEKINPNPHVMSKAQFDALRELRKQQYAGSGFVEWGKHRDGELEVAINQGMYDAQTTPNAIKLGRRDSDGLGVSKAAFPLAAVGGVQHVIEGVNEPDSISNNIPFPPAPDGTKTYNSATGVVTEHASAAQAFEGLVTNGDFRDGANNWAPYNATLSVTDKVITVTSTTSGTGNVSQQASLTAGVECIVRVVARQGTNNGTSASLSFWNATDGHMQQVTLDSTEFKEYILRGTPTVDSVVIFYTGTGLGSEVIVSNVSVMPVTESVITSRKDLVFLETWHEKISDKDIVFPLGNVQFISTISESSGVPVWPIESTFGIPKSYSAFGEWDTVTEGRGARWSTISDKERKKFVDNPENNIYYDSEADELIQVRYRVRVIEGQRNEWHRVQADDTTVINKFLGHSSSNQQSVVKPRGARIEVLDLGSHPEGGLGMYKTPFTVQSNPEAGIGAFFACKYDGSVVQGISSNNKCYSIPIALVQRLNQGAYHPTYNPMGCKTWAAVGVSLNLKWHSNGAVGLINSTAHCFEPENLGTRPTPTARSGYIGAEDADSGRSDQYKYYDAIYAGQVEDLRLNANKLDVNQLREESMRKAVAGEMRGKGSVPFTSTFISSKTVTGSSSGAIKIAYGDITGFGSVYEDRLDLEGNCFGQVVEDATGKVHDIISVGSDGSAWTFFVSDPIPVGLVVSAALYRTNILSAEYDSLPWVDIIGDPERIAVTFPDGVVGQWIPQIPNGSQLELNLNRKSEGSIISTLYTDNDASSWTSISTSVNGITNTITGTKPSTRVELHTYESPSNFTVSSSSTAVVGDVGDVYASQAHQVKYGNRLQPSLMGKVGKRSGGAYLQEFVSITKYSKYAPDGDLGWTSVIGDDPLHAPLSLDKPNDSSPAVKALSTVTEKDGLLYLQLHGAELKHTPRTIADMTVINAGSPTGSITKGHVYLFQGFDNALVNRPMVALVDHAGTTWNSSSYNGYTLNDVGEVMTNTGTKFTLIRSFDSHWGDDQVIPIVNGENVKTDLNGNTVKVFCHHTQIPLGIASN